MADAANSQISISGGMESQNSCFLSFSSGLCHVMLKMAVRFERLVTQGDDAELGKAAFLLGGGQDNDTEREL